MGLDVYAVRPNRSQLTEMASVLRLPDQEREEITWLPPSDVTPFREISRDFATGGLAPASDGDPSGFRGEVYESWLSDEFGFSLYQPFDPSDVRALLERLDGWLPNAGKGRTPAPPLGGPEDGYALARARSFVAFVRASTWQRLWFHPDF